VILAPCTYNKNSDFSPESMAAFFLKKTIGSQVSNNDDKLGFNLYMFISYAITEGFRMKYHSNLK
jgi:hypothetical protein